MYLQVFLSVLAIEFAGRNFTDSIYMYVIITFLKSVLSTTMSFKKALKIKIFLKCFLNRDNGYGRNVGDNVTTDTRFVT